MVLETPTELIEHAAHGDQEAFRQLWETHHAAAMAAVLRLCHQRALAEEITQGTFLLAWRGLPRFQQGRPFRPWLMRILYRHALDVMEQQRTYLRPLSLDEALEQLSAEHRHVIALHYGADLTEVDIAQVLGWPVGTVKSRLNRARERLRAIFNQGER